MNRNSKAFYVEPAKKTGGFAATKGGASRASLKTDTQKQAIDQVARKHPEAPIHVARVRNTDVGHPDQFRQVKKGKPKP